MSCVVEGCKSHTGRKESDQEVISFHRFPNNQIIKDQWIEQVNRTNWNWNYRSHICSKHFTPNSFIPNSHSKWRRLKPDAIPTLHIFPSDTLEIKPECLNEIWDIDPPTESCADVSLAHEVKTEVESLPDIQQECDKNVVNESLPDIKQECDKNVVNESLPDIKQECDTSDQPVCNQMHEKTIIELQRELERVKKISRRRLRKINTLTKRVTRLSKRTDDLYSILVDKLQQENVETEHLML